MSNTYTQIHIHIVFAVQNRACKIGNSWKEDLYKYITGIIQKQNHKLLAINGMPDHIHILIGMRPNQSLSDLLQDIKGSSSKWINENRFLPTKFSWQEGYGAFSYSKSHLKNVTQYIHNQEIHHQHKSFIEEYKDILKKFKIEFDEKFIFKSID